MFAKGRTVNIAVPPLFFSFSLSLCESGSCARFVHANSGNQSKRTKERERNLEELNYRYGTEIPHLLLFDCCGDKNGSRVQNLRIRMRFLSCDHTHKPSHLLRMWRPYNASTNSRLGSLQLAKCRANKHSSPSRDVSILTSAYLLKDNLQSDAILCYQFLL